MELRSYQVAKTVQRLCQRTGVGNVPVEGTGEGREDLIYVAARARNRFRPIALSGRCCPWLPETRIDAIECQTPTHRLGRKKGTISEQRLII